MDAITASVDAPVLERLAKILGYMRVSGSGQPGKRLRRKDKLRMLDALKQQDLAAEEMGGAAARTPAGANGLSNGALKMPLPPTAAAKVASRCSPDSSSNFLQPSGMTKTSADPEFSQGFMPAGSSLAEGPAGMPLCRSMRGALLQAG